MNSITWRKTPQSPLQLFFYGTKWNGTCSCSCQSIWDVILMDVIRQVGSVSECICNVVFILLREVMWYGFIHAQVELTQLAKPKTIWEAETLSQDHPDSRSKSKNSLGSAHIPRPSRFSATPLFTQGNSIVPPGPAGNSKSSCSYYSFLLPWRVKEGQCRTASGMLGYVPFWLPRP